MDAQDARDQDRSLKTILRIWERWTDGNPAVRRVLDRDSTDPPAGRDGARDVLRVMGRLQVYGRTPSVRAAIAAGWAGIYCSRHEAEEVIAPAVQHAVRADLVARQAADR